jgi:hypothetical protein
MSNGSLNPIDIAHAAERHLGRSGVWEVQHRGCYQDRWSPRPPAATATGVPIPPPAVAAQVRSAGEGHREWIEAQVRLGRNAMAIYQELVDTRGFVFAYI